MHVVFPTLPLGQAWLEALWVCAPGGSHSAPPSVHFNEEKLGEDRKQLASYSS